MPRTSDDLLESVAPIASADGKTFGTGFAIHSEQSRTWLVTCAHVVNKIKKTGEGNIFVRGQRAEVVVPGTPEGADLAVLRVSGLQLPALKFT